MKIEEEFDTEHSPLSVVSSEASFWSAVSSWDISEQDELLVASVDEKLVTCDNHDTAQHEHALVPERMQPAEIKKIADTGLHKSANAVITKSVDSHGDQNQQLKVDKQDGQSSSAPKQALQKRHPKQEPDATSELKVPKGIPHKVYPLHWAAFHNNAEALRHLLPTVSKTDLAAFDEQGHTALHLAALRRASDAVTALLEGGAPAYAKDARGWMPMVHAVEARDRDLAIRLYKAEMSQIKLQMKEKRARLVESVRKLPNFSLQLKWELGCTIPGVGLLLRKHIPFDKYTIWKVGPRIRVDGTLMGIVEDNHSVLPEWKRGHFSLLYDSSGEKVKLLFVNHGKRKYYDIKALRKKVVPMDDSVIEAEVDEMLKSDVIEVTKIRSSEFKFKPVTTWFSNATLEKVEGWNTQVYEASGKMLAVSKTKAPLALPRFATFDSYLTQLHAPDQVVEVAFNPLTTGALMDGGGKPKPKDMDGEEAARVSKKVKVVSGKCWMAQGFPLSLKQLIPLLEVIGTANKHIRKVGRFMSKYGDLRMFPVKINIPLVMTVHATLSFQQFKLLRSNELPPVTFFEVPPGFVMRDVPDLDILSGKHKKLGASGSKKQARDAYGDEDGEFSYL